MRRVDDDDIDAGLDQARNPLLGIETGANGRPDTQRAALILTGKWEVGSLLKVLGRDHPAEPETLVDDENLLDPMLVQETEHLFLGGALLDRDQPLLGCHDGRHRRFELGLEPEVAVRDDADELFSLDDRHAGYILRPRQLDDITDRRLGLDRDRVADDAALEFLDDLNLARLLGRRHVLVDDADAAFLGDRDCEPGLGDRVHRCRDDRNVERKPP